MNLTLEINSATVRDNPPLTTQNGGCVMVTPPIDDDYWLFRVPVSERQALVAFPKFGTIGIGFHHEEDWNTNLPYSSDAAAIFEHIEHNRGDPAITRETCIAAIEMLRERASEVMRNRKRK